MSQIRFFTEEQEALIPELQAKWKNVALSTERIDRDRAREALNEVYVIMGKRSPEIVFCDSPLAGLERLETYVAQVEIPQANINQSLEEMMQGLNFAKFFAQAFLGSLQQNSKRKKSEARVISDLLKKLSQKPNNLFKQHIDNVLPHDLTTQEIVKQSFSSASNLFQVLGKQEAQLGEPYLLRTMEKSPLEEWGESFTQTATALEQQLSWLPAKKFLFRQWLKRFLQGSISSHITGIEYPQLTAATFTQLSFPQRKFLGENPPILTSDLALQFILLDFYFSVMNYSCKATTWNALQNLVQSCGWILGVDGTCVICDRPTKILIDEDQQLHGEGEPALEYADGIRYYAYHGFNLPEKYGVVHPSQWQPEWVLSEENKQLKKVLIQGIGAVRICQELSLIEVETRGEYTLFKLDENTRTKAIHILKRINAETEEIKAVLLPWLSSDLTRAIQYAHQNYSSEDFPLVD